MRIHVLQHESYESPGYIEDWIKEKNYTLTFTRFYESGTLPGLNEFDWLIIMGGPMGVYDDNKFLWLKEEKVFIKSAIDAGKIVLGICLGSQLIAAALGAKVYPNKFKEIGWFNIKLTKNAKDNFLFSSFQDQIKVFQWHGDTFDLPAGAIRLAESEACKNQAFVVNDKVIALQFHFEVTESSLHEMVAEGINELVHDKYVQTGEDILRQKNLIHTNNKMMDALLNKIEDKFL
ncbi:MAG: type 1 glutamine amidotransferase [Ignavibacteriaceae bacterium]